MYIDPDTYPDRPVVVTLANGTVLRDLLAWHPWLEAATPEQRAVFELGTFSIDWPALDEGLDIEGMKRRIPSDPTLKAAYYAADVQMLSDEEKRLLHAYRTSPEDRRDAIRDLLAEH